MKEIANGKRRKVEFAIGDLVYVRLQPYEQNSLALHKNKKLSMHYIGLFKIIERIGSVAYRLHLLDTIRIHPAFHISLLKKCVGHPQQQVIPTALLKIETGQQWVNSDLEGKVNVNGGSYDTGEGPKKYLQEGRMVQDPENTVTNKLGAGNEKAKSRKHAKPKWLRDYIR